MSNLVKEIQIPKAFSELFEPKRYKVYYGGRGGAKSHNMARALLIKGMEQPLRILCARELQNSIGDSVHKLLSDIVYAHGLEFHYEVQKATIKGKNGTEFIFKGMKHNAQEIKSTEGIDIAWVEEAEKVSDNSWELLIPTIRKPNSEIWVSFNPKNPTDPTCKRFLFNQTDDMLVKKVSWQDNPFFPDVLEKERLKMYNSDKVAYDHIWEGEFDERRNGSVYANLIVKARDEGRITTVPYKPGVPVITAWDLGKRHATTIWFGQIVGFQKRIIDYYEATGDDADIEKLAGVVLNKDYLYDMHWLPHDAKHERLGMKGSISSQLKTAGIKNNILPNISEAAGIEQTKQLLKEVYMQDDLDGIHPLMHFHYEWDDNRNCFKDKPYDDWSKDAADGLRYLAIAFNKKPDYGVSSSFNVVTKPVEWSVI